MQTSSTPSRDPAEATDDLELRPPRRRVSRSAIGYWAVRALLGWLLLIAIQVIIMVTAQDASDWHVVALVITGVIAAAHLVVMPRWRYHVHRWEAAPQAVYTQAGWFDQERRIAPISRIQTIDSERGPLEQLFGLANVTVTTASAAGPLKIHGLDRATAEQLVEELTTTTQATRGDAT